MNTYTIKLTKKQAGIVADAGDFEGWKDYYLQWEDEPARLAEDSDVTEDRAKFEIEAARASELTDDCLTLVAGSLLESDVYDWIESETSGFQRIITKNFKPGALRTIANLLPKFACHK